MGEFGEFLISGCSIFVIEWFTVVVVPKMVSKLSKYFLFVDMLPYFGAMSLVRGTLFPNSICFIQNMFEEMIYDPSASL